MSKTPREIIDDLLEYAVKFAEQEDEPNDGGCWDAIEQARAYLSQSAAEASRENRGLGKQGALGLLREAIASCDEGINGEWDVSADGLGAIVENLVAVEEYLSAEPSLMRWTDLGQALPPEQKNIVVMLQSGIPLLGRNIDGRFAEYDSINDRFVEWNEGQADGFSGISRWAEVDQPSLRDLRNERVKGAAS